MKNITAIRVLRRACRLAPTLRALALLLFMVSGPLPAAQVGGLYEAEVPVVGQETEQRNQSIVEAFRRVLVKVTGNRGIVRHPLLGSDIAEAPRYVQQYRYRLIPVDATSQTPPEPLSPSGGPAAPQPPSPAGEVAEPGSPAEPRRMLRVSFDESAVNRLLRQRGLSIWGDTRPAILLWLTTEQAGRRALLVPEVEEATLGAVMAAAEQRGMPLLLPLMDLEDQSRLQISDLWGGFADNIREASRRYGADAIFTGRLVQFAPDLWRASWTLYLEQDALIWDSEGDSLEMASEAGVQAGIDMLASRFAPVVGGEDAGRIRLRISGIGSLAAYARVNRYLWEQSGAERVDLVYVEPDAVVYSLRVRGGKEALEQRIALSGTLLPLSYEIGAVASPDPASDSMGIALHYHLQP
jgi:hypothetical protein